MKNIILLLFIGTCNVIFIESRCAPKTESTTVAPAEVTSTSEPIVLTTLPGDEQNVISQKSRVPGKSTTPGEEPVVTTTLAPVDTTVFVPEETTSSTESSTVPSEEPSTVAPEVPTTVAPEVPTTVAPKRCVTKN